MPPVPLPEALALPISVKRATQKPTPVYVPYNGIFQKNTVKQLTNISMGIYSCFIPDRNCEFARFQTVKNQTSCKRSKINFTTKPLLQYSFPPAFTKSGIGFCNATRSKRQDTAKLHIFGEIQNQKTVGRARERSTVCKDKSVCLNQNFQPRRTRGCTLVVKVKSWPPSFDSVVCTSLMPLVIVVTSVFTLPGNMSVMVNPSSTPTKRPL